VRKINVLLLTLLFLVFTGCEDKKPDGNTIPVENTTEVFTSTDGGKDNTNRFRLQQNNKQETTSDTAQETSFFDTFTLHNMKNESYSTTVSNQKVTLKQNNQAIVLVTFFATWCPPCVADIAYMNDLKKSYQKDLFLAGVLVHDTITKERLRSFLAKHEIKYFVASGTENNDFASLVAKTLHLPKNFSIPLTVMYVEGNYFTHYEGCVPVEMIDYDIQQALKILK